MFKKSILALIFGLLSLSALASDKLVLLTSLDPDENRPRFRRSSWDINQKLENIFYDRLTPYHTTRENIKIIHFATIEDLTRELADPENKAVFWVSHSNGSNANSALDKNVVVDYQGKDLSEGFQNPSSKLQYLGFVGCFADFLVQKNLANGYMQNNENLIINSSTKKVDARRALKYAIGNYLYHHFEGNLQASQKACAEVTRHELIIRRTIPIDITEDQYITSIKILQRDKLVGLFPKGKPGELQEIKVKLVPGEVKRDIKLVFDSGIASNQIAMGEFEVLGADYQVFSTRDGRPLGRGRYVFNYKGSIEELPQTIITTKQNCIE
jgi:hypothetical protein